MTKFYFLMNIFKIFVVFFKKKYDEILFLMNLIQNFRGFFQRNMTKNLHF